MPIAQRELIHKVVLLSEAHRQDEITAIRIIRCESGLKDINNTTLNKNGTTDYGYWQINEIHRKEARNRGFDITEPDQNLEYGMLMLKEQGTKPWDASKYCWAS